MFNAVVTLFLGHVLAAAAQAAPPTVQDAAEVLPETLLVRYLADHPALWSDAAFARDWTTTTKCLAWSPISDDEFRGPAFLKAGAAGLAGMSPGRATTFVVRFDRFLEPYNPTKQEFGLATLQPRAVLPVRITDFGGEAGGSNFRRGCTPTSGSLPLRYDLSFDNASVANGMPMTPDQAEAYARSRTNQSGRRENGVVVEVRFILSASGTSRPVAAGGVKGLIVPFTAHIVDVLVEDATPQRKVAYRVSENKLKAGEAEAATV